MRQPNKQTPGSKPKEGKILLVTEETELMKFLIHTLSSQSRNHIKSLLTHRLIKVDGKTISQYNHPLKPGQEIEITTGKRSDPAVIRGIDIIYEDKYLIVINKHEGLLSIATEDEKKETAYSLLSNYVKSQHFQNKIFVVHRLDRETSGIMMFAKNPNVQELLQEAWNMNVTERIYLAIVEGQVEKDQDTITSYLRESKSLIVHSSKDSVRGSQKAITHYKVLDRNQQYSLLEVVLETGRKNQIRVHMKDIGHPVVGDKKYGSTQNPIKRLGLHAAVLAFTHPVTKEVVRFSSGLPKPFYRLFPKIEHKE